MRPVSLADVMAELDDATLLPPSSPSSSPKSVLGNVLPAEVLLTDVTLDSREVRHGALFACRPGARTDGHDHAGYAVASGAVALLVERPLPLRVPQVQVASVAAEVGRAAARVYGFPSRELALAGVTGTNGKTTTAYMIEAAVRAAGHRTGLIGTVQTMIDGQAQPGVRTTPEATELQRLLRTMRDRDVTAAAMEVSSHGLALGRVRGTQFSVAVFTNLTQDHLDFHSDLEDYFAAKATLFTAGYTDRVVINIDGPYGVRLVQQAEREGLQVTTVSLRDTAAAVHAKDIVLGPTGSTFTAMLQGRSLSSRVQLPGAFNVANALGALAAVAAMEMDPDEAMAGIAALSGVPGRMERVDRGQPFTVLVDYAHTPDSVEHVLRAARELTTGRVIVVVGCGGDRDRGKRGPMGRAAAGLADLAIFTSDNPRSEDPGTILEAMASGARTTSGEWALEPSRYDAIALAFDAAVAGDVVVIAGKGHEGTQEFAEVTVPFDDREVSAELLTTRFERWAQ